MTDNEKEALILQFDEGVEFISKALESGAVLVHWWVFFYYWSDYGAYIKTYLISYYGVSRSATMVLAYLMKKYSLDFDEAMQRLIKQALK